MAGRKAMIDRDHELPVTRQAEPLGISRGAMFYLPRPESPTDLALMRRLDELHLKRPFVGARVLRDRLQRQGMLRPTINSYDQVTPLEGDQSAVFHSCLG